MSRPSCPDQSGKGGADWCSAWAGCLARWAEKSCPCQAGPGFGLARTLEVGGRRSRRGRWPEGVVVWWARAVRTGWGGLAARARAWPAAKRATPRPRESARVVGLRGPSGQTGLDRAGEGTPLLPAEAHRGVGGRNAGGEQGGAPWRRWCVCVVVAAGTHSSGCWWLVGPLAAATCWATSPGRATELGAESEPRGEPCLGSEFRKHVKRPTIDCLYCLCCSACWGLPAVVWRRVAAVLVRTAAATDRQHRPHHFGTGPGCLDPW